MRSCINIEHYNTWNMWFGIRYNEYTFISTKKFNGVHKYKRNVKISVFFDVWVCKHTSGVMPQKEMGTLVCNY